MNYPVSNRTAFLFYHGRHWYIFMRFLRQISLRTFRHTMEEVVRSVTKTICLGAVVGHLKFFEIFKRKISYLHRSLKPINHACITMTLKKFDFLKKSNSLFCPWHNKGFVAYKSNSNNCFQSLRVQRLWQIQNLANTSATLRITLRRK